ncbi:MAG: 30S ribosomal protein S21 [Chloroflexota bacterium]
MSEIIIRNSAEFDQALRKFNKMVQQTGVLAEAGRREHYEPPSVVRKRKAAAKRRKTLKNAQRSA